MADRNTTTTLNTGSGGDSMDESNVYAVSTTTGAEAAVGNLELSGLGANNVVMAITQKEKVK